MIKINWINNTGTLKAHTPLTATTSKQDRIPKPKGINICLNCTKPKKECKGNCKFSEENDDS